jgi:hypothetical protein
MRAEGGMDRNGLIDKAVKMARDNDAELARIVSEQIVPRRLGGYQMKQRSMAQAFGTPEDPEIIGVKRA